MVAVLKQKNFALLWSGGLISMMGDWMLMAALPFQVYALTNSALAVSGILMTMVIPRILFGSVAGVFVDRWDRKSIMVITSALQALVITSLLLVRSAEWVWIIYLTTFLEYTLGVFFAPAEGALLPNLVGEEHLVAANSLNAMNDNLARIAGPALGGVLLGTLGFESVILADMSSYLIAMTLILLIRAKNTSPERDTQADVEQKKGDVQQGGVWNELKAGLQYIKTNKALTGLFLVLAIALFGDAIISVLMVVFVQEEMGLGAVEYGWLFAARGIGGLLGGVLVGNLGQKFSSSQLISGGLIGSGIAVLAILTQPTLVVMIVVMILMGPVLMAWLISLQTVAQKEAEDAFRGRVLGLLGMTMGFMMFFGSAIAGSLADQIGTIIMIAVAGGFYILAGSVSPLFFGNTKQIPEIQTETQ